MRGVLLNRNNAVLVGTRLVLCVKTQMLLGNWTSKGWLFLERLLLRINLHGKPGWIGNHSALFCSCGGLCVFSSALYSAALHCKIKICSVHSCEDWCYRLRSSIKSATTSMEATISCIIRVLLGCCLLQSELRYNFFNTRILGSFPFLSIGCMAIFTA